MAAKKKKKIKNRLISYIVTFWLLIICGISGIALLFFAISKGALGPLPSFKELENPDPYLATEIYSADNKVIGKYFYENRSNVAYEDISPNLVNALVATEDVRFYEHSGVDLLGLLRVAVKTVILQQPSGGGSTITQQLAKNLFHKRPSSTLERVQQKLKEWVIAVKLEKSYTKDEILTMYLNTVSFGENAYGIKAASKTFFNKEPYDLNIEEAAVLVGMLKATTYFNPRRNPENSKTRRNVVIGQMEKYAFIDEKVADSLQALPIELDYHQTNHNLGLAPYFRERLRLHLQDWSKENIKVDGSHYNIYKDGLKIYTTLDSRLQKIAETVTTEHISDMQNIFFEKMKGVKNAPFDRQLTKEDIENIMWTAIKRTYRYRVLKKEGLSKDSILTEFKKPHKMTVFTWQGEKDTTMSPYDSIRYYKSFMQAGFMAMEPNTGHIRAWVGGIDHKYFKYDHVNKRSKRQVGSTFKPFVYTVAIDNGWSPCFEVPNAPVTFEEFDNWTPENADHEYGGMLTLQEGLANSINTVTAYVMKQVGPQAVVNLARKLGITSPMEAYPSIALGTPDISVYEMVGAYATYANKGVWTKPMFITRIEDKNGNVIQEFHPEKVEVMNEQTAYVMLVMLQNVVNKGTAGRLRFRHNLYNEMGGKTGTTQNHSDGWFMGVTPELVGGVWTGWEDRSVHFRQLYYGQGATMALPVWGNFLSNVYADSTLGYSYETKFERPSSPMTIELDCSKYEQDQDDPEKNYFGSEFGN